MRGLWILLGLFNLAIAQKNDTDFTAQGLQPKGSSSPVPSPAADLDAGDAQRGVGRTYDTCTKEIKFVKTTVTEHKTHTTTCTEVSRLLFLECQGPCRM